MANVRTCDCCEKVITDENPVVAKVYLAPIKAGETRKSHSGYTASMDVGKCCFGKVNKLGKWSKRRYQTRKTPA